MRHPVGVPVAVRRDRERHLARPGRREAEHARRGRVHLHLVRQVDRPVLRGEMDARLVDALGDEAARVVAAVPGVPHRPAPQPLAGDERPHDVPVAVDDLEPHAVRLAQLELDRGDPRRAVARRREHLRDPRREDRARLDLQALRDRERGCRPAEQRDDEQGREEAGHGPAMLRASTPRRPGRAASRRARAGVAPLVHDAQRARRRPRCRSRSPGRRSAPGRASGR